MTCSSDTVQHHEGRTSQGLCNLAHTPLGVVDAPVVAVTKHHASIHHRSEVSQHCAPAVALNVYEPEQFRILDMFACYITSVGG